MKETPPSPEQEIQPASRERSAGSGGDLADRVAANDWYHSIELPGGVLTPGYFDTRSAARDVLMPASLEGKRCLDVGTFDGFWAFEMEQRGADEVVGIDVQDPEVWDWPATTTAAAYAAFAEPRLSRHGGFEIAREALGSSVERWDLSVYDLDPDRHGMFDFVYLGSLLLHLRDPILALERARAVCSGEILVVDAIDVGLTLRVRRPAATLDAIGRPWWWKPNVAGLRRMLEAAGLEVTSGPKRFYMRFGAAGARPSPGPRALLRRGGFELALMALRGDPHAAVLARPDRSGSQAGAGRER
jgi:tRNA (mo5U34)-methyltransferase